MPRRFGSVPDVHEEGALAFGVILAADPQVRAADQPAKQPSACGGVDGAERVAVLLSEKAAKVAPAASACAGPSSTASSASAASTPSARSDPNSHCSQAGPGER